MQKLWLTMWEPPEEYRLVIAVFLKGLGIIYAIAFASLAVQIEGLSGSQGILPLIEQHANLETTLGWKRFFVFPSLFWLNASDWALSGAAWLGAAVGLALSFGLWPRVMLILAYVLYLSLYHAGSVFMNFQWDTLLLETGFLAIFLAGGGARIVIWLMRWLLFRLRFLSGISKLASGDPLWANLTALTTYFEVQPLPHVGAWYFHHLPQGILKAGAFGVLVVEILVPFLFLAPRRWRMVGAWLTIALQVLIIATSNHNFINLLTILLCLFLFDDQAIRRWVPQFITAPPALPWGRWAQTAFAPFATFIAAVTAIQVASMVVAGNPPGWMRDIERLSLSFAIAHRYHVFPTMKAERIEIVVEWSYDGRTWQPLDFKYKPGDPAEAPPLIAPHHPRLDWHMWFVPMGRDVFVMPYQRFVERLLEGSEPVLGLLPDDAFASGPPRFIRAHGVRYRFTDWTERAQHDRWWKVEWLGPFWPSPWIERKNM